MVTTLRWDFYCIKSFWKIEGKSILHSKRPLPLLGLDHAAVGVRSSARWRRGRDGFCAITCPVPLGISLLSVIIGFSKKHLDAHGGCLGFDDTGCFPRVKKAQWLEGLENVAKDVPMRIS